MFKQMTCWVSSRHTWDEKPHGDSVFSVRIAGYTLVFPSILSPNPTDLQGGVRQQLHPSHVCSDGTARSVPCQVVAHGTFHLTGQHGHTAHRGSHIYCGSQNRGRLCFCRNMTKTSVIRKLCLPLRLNVCARMLPIWFLDLKQTQMKFWNCFNDLIVQCVC